MPRVPMLESWQQPSTLGAPGSPPVAPASSVADEAVAMDGIARDFDAPEIRDFHHANARAAIMRSSGSREGVAAFERRADMVVLRRYIDRQDAKGARSYLEQTRARLGDDAAGFDERIAAVEAAAAPRKPGAP